MNLHDFFKFSTLGSISHCGNTLWAMNFIIYDPAGKERNNFEQPKINWKFISTNNSYWPY